MGLQKQTISISSRDYWFKIVEFIQQNWALIENYSDGKSCIVFFISDAAGVFDKLNFESVAKAEQGLLRNGFRRYSDDKEAQGFIAPPKPLFFEAKHPNGPIYSSGRFWK